MKNYNSAENQEIKGDFVSREVFGNISTMVEYILKQDDSSAPFSWEDVENLYAVNEDGEEEPQEILEWWSVSNWLAEKLAKHGESVMIIEGIWGRTCSGQAIKLDSVINEICEEAGLLK